VHGVGRELAVAAGVEAGDGALDALVELVKLGGKRRAEALMRGVLAFFAVTIISSAWAGLSAMSLSI
jgi:hypothetical protein